MGFFTAILAVLYLFLAFAVKRTTEIAFRFQEFLMGIGFLFLVIAVPIQFDRPWIVIAWAAEALVITFFGFQIGSKFLKAFGQVVYLISFIRLLFFDLTILEKINPIFNERFFTFIACFVFFAIGAVVYWYRRRETSGEENNIFSALLIESGIIFLTSGSLEISDFFSRWQLPVFWAFSGLIIGFISLSLKDLPFRFVSYVLFTLSFFDLLIVESKISVLGYTPVFNTRTLSFLLVALIIGGFVYLLHNKKESLLKEEKEIGLPILFVGINFLLLWLISIEILGYFDSQYRQLPAFEKREKLIIFKNLKNVYLSVAWTIYAIILLIIGISKRFTFARLLAILLLGVVIFKVFLYDTANLNNLYRFISFIVLGVILLLSGYLYYRYRDRITEFIKVGPEKIEKNS
jgi:hypothetical protein